MKTIHKVELAVKDRQVIRMRKNSVILSVGVQRGNAVLWYEFEDNEPQWELRVIEMIGTGNYFEGNSALVHLGTLVGIGVGAHLVMHVFEDTKPVGMNKQEEARV